METITTSDQQPNRLERMARVMSAAVVIVAAAMSPEAVQATDASTPNPGAIVHVETFNIEGSNHPVSYHLGTPAARARRTGQIVMGKAGAEAADITGFQEVEPEQRRLLNHELSSHYNSVPRSQTQNPIYYRRNRFKQIATGIVHYPYYGDNRYQKTGDAVWVRLKDTKSGAYYSVINEHSVAWNEDGGWAKDGADKRLATAKIMNKWLQGTRQHHAHDIIIEVGDLNSTNNLRIKPDRLTPKPKDLSLHGDRNKLPYCIQTQYPSRMQSAYDMVHNYYGHCPNKNHNYLLDFTVDWVFTSPDTATVTSYERIKNEITKHTSDHNPILVGIAPKPR